MDSYHFISLTNVAIEENDVLKKAKEIIGILIQDGPGENKIPRGFKSIINPETVLKDLDFTGKTVRVISTHEGSGISSMISDVKRICKGALVDTNGLAIKGSRAKQSEETIRKWL